MLTKYEPSLLSQLNVIRMTSPKSSPSVKVVVHSWSPEITVHVSVNMYEFSLCDNLTLKRRPPVEDQFEYTSIGEADINADTRTYSGIALFFVID
jgi:hypothetical protein